MGRAEERRQRAKKVSPTRKAATAALLCLALGSGAILVSSQPARADNRIYVTGTDGGLALRTDPSTNGGIHWRLNDGETATFKCYTHGEYVAGVNHTDVWFKVWYPRQDGSFQEGYISAAFTTVTPTDLANLTGSWDIVECGGTSTPPSVRHEPSGVRIDSNGYNRFEAINWALQHAQEAQPKWGGCTWFVSQALWAGGMQQIRGEWTDDDRKPTKVDKLDDWKPGTSSRQAVGVFATACLSNGARARLHARQQFRARCRPGRYHRLRLGRRRRH